MDYDSWFSHYEVDVALLKIHSHLVVNFSPELHSLLTKPVLYDIYLQSIE